MSGEQVTKIILDKLDDIEKRVAAIEKKQAWVFGIFATLGVMFSTLGVKLYTFISAGIK